MEELQQAIELELGKQHRLEKWPTRLGTDLAQCPGIDLRARVAALKEVVGLEEAATLLKQHPSLLVRVHPAEVPARLDAIAAAMGTDRKAILGLCTRVKGAAMILQMLPNRTAERVEALCSVMQLTPKELLKKCTKCAIVLRVEPGAVHSRAAALGDGLGLDAAGVAELCRRSPACLIVPSSTVVAAVEAVQVALGVCREEAVQLCLGCPSLLQQSPGSVGAKARELTKHLGLQGEGFAKHMVRQQPT